MFELDIELDNEILKKIKLFMECYYILSCLKLCLLIEGGKILEKILVFN